MQLIEIAKELQNIENFPITLLKRDFSIDAVLAIS